MGVGRATAVVLWIACSIAIVSTGEAGATNLDFYGHPLPPVRAACLTHTWDPASGTLVLPLQTDQTIDVKLADSLDYAPYESPTPGRIGEGSAVVNLERHAYRAACSDQVHADPTVPWWQDEQSFSLDEVRVLRLTVEPGAAVHEVRVCDWLRIIDRIGHPLTIEVGGPGGGPAHDVRFTAGQCWSGDPTGAPDSRRFDVRVPSPHELDLDADGVVDLRWLADPGSVSVSATSMDDGLDLHAFDVRRLTVSGGAGVDRIAAPVRADASSDVFGGAGNDNIVGGGARLTADGGEGDDIITGTASADAIRGGLGADNLLGLTGDDRIQGEGMARDPFEEHEDRLAGGPDTIDAGAGNDVVDSGPGSDLVEGGDGDDQLRTGDGDDQIHGGAGSDLLGPGAGNDRSWGGPGNDRIGARGGSRATDSDIAWGESGNDSLDESGARAQGYGGSGNDRIRYVGGWPIIDAGTGNDYVQTVSVRGMTVDLGPGNDVFHGKGVCICAPQIGRRMTLRCGAGKDWSSWQPVRVTNCEWQQQRDRWDDELGRPHRDDTKIPSMPRGD